MRSTLKVGSRLLHTLSTSSSSNTKILASNIVVVHPKLNRHQGLRHIISTSFSSSTSSSAPFGLGPRACPAGSLSIMLAREALETLLLHHDWTLADPNDAKWVTEMFCSPNLCVRSDIEITFTPVDSNNGSCNYSTNDGIGGSSGALDCSGEGCIDNQNGHCRRGADV